jgi:hypothetical protein
MAKEAKTHTEMVADALARKCASYDASKQFDAAQRKNGNVMRDMLQRVIDARTVKILSGLPTVNDAAHNAIVSAGLAPVPTVGPVSDGATVDHNAS